MVSLHDVTPAHAGRVDKVLRVFEEFGVDQYAVFVVPNWHGAWPLEKYPEFVSAIRSKENSGVEVFLHGLRHDEVGIRRGVGDQLRAWGRTAREGEFLSLSPDEAAARIETGARLLSDLGFRPVGFVPPAWLHGRGLSEVLLHSGFSISEDANAILDLTNQRRINAPAVRWSTRKWWRAVAGVGIAAIRRPIEKNRSVIRLAVHPPDIEHPAVAASLKKTLDVLLTHRTPVSYRKLLERTR